MILSVETDSARQNGRGYGTPCVHSLNRNLARADWVKALRKFELFHARMTLQTQACLVREFGGRKPTPNKNPFLFGWARFLIGPETIKRTLCQSHESIRRSDTPVLPKLFSPAKSAALWTARCAGGSSTVSESGYGFKFGWLRSGLTRYLRNHPTPPASQLPIFSSSSAHRA